MVLTPRVPIRLLSRYVKREEKKKERGGEEGGGRQREKKKYQSAPMNSEKEKGDLDLDSWFSVFELYYCDDGVTGPNRK